MAEVNRINDIASIIKQFGENVDLAQGAKKDEKGRINSAIGKRLKADYEKEVEGLFERFLMNDIEVEEFHKEEVSRAEKIANRTLKNINILSEIGHGEESIGKAEYIFQGEMYRTKVDAGMIKKGEND